MVALRQFAASAVTHVWVGRLADLAACLLLVDSALHRAAGDGQSGRAERALTGGGPFPTRRPICRRPRAAAQSGATRETELPRDCRRPRLHARCLGTAVLQRLPLPLP